MLAVLWPDLCACAATQAADSMQLLLLVLLAPSLGCEWALTEMEGAGVIMVRCCGWCVIGESMWAHC